MGPHRRGAGGVSGDEAGRQPKICMDDEIFGDTDEQGKSTSAHVARVQDIWDAKTKACFASAVKHKGRCEWSARRVVQGIDILGHAKIMLKTD